MKKILSVLLLGSVAHAQTSSTTTSATSVNSATSSAASPAAGTSATNLQTVAQPKKIGFKIISENGATIGSLKDNSEGGYSQNSFGLSYKINASHAVEVRAITLTEFNKASEDSLSKSHVTKMADPTVHYNYVSGVSLLGSAPMVFANRYYVPVSQASMDAKSNGVLRSQTGLEWEVNPRLSLGLGVQARLMLSKPEAQNGGDAALRMISGPSATYNFNDKFSAYYSPYLETVASNFSRGDFKADKANNLIHEVGLNIKVANVEINPAIVTLTQGLGKTTYEGFGADNNTEYDLNVVAIF